MISNTLLIHILLHKQIVIKTPLSTGEIKQKEWESEQKLGETSKEHFNIWILGGLSWNTTLDQVQTWEAKDAALSTQAGDLPLIILQQHVLNTRFFFFFCKEIDCCLCLPMNVSTLNIHVRETEEGEVPPKQGFFCTTPQQLFCIKKTKVDKMNIWSKSWAILKSTGCIS